MKNEEHYICCEVEYKAHTDAAVLVAQHGNEIWVPRSCLPWRSDKDIDELMRGETWQMRVASWFAQKNELEGD